MYLTRGRLYGRETAIRYESTPFRYKEIVVEKESGDEVKGMDYEKAYIQIIEMRGAEKDERVGLTNGEEVEDCCAELGGRIDLLEERMYRLENHDGDPSVEVVDELIGKKRRMNGGDGPAGKAKRRNV